MAQKKKGIGKRLLGGLMGLCIGVAAGYVFAILAVYSGINDLDGPAFVLALGIGVVLLALAAYLQIVIHEGGHLVAGLATGYRFSSFRVGSLMLIRKDGHLVLKRFSLAGTGGQCLLAPPDMVDGRFPYALYNAGGVIANLVTAAACLVILLAMGGGSRGEASWAQMGLKCFLIAMVIVGVAYALMNGIPIRVGPVPNDGWNVLHLGKNPQALRSIWLQLTVNATLSEGTRLKDMPSEWFVVPPDDQMADSFVASVGVFAQNRMMDEHHFAEARELAQQLLEPQVGTPDIYQHMLACDVACCNVLTDAPAEDVDKSFEALEEPDVKATLKAMKDNPSVLRTRYIQALYAGDDAQAQKIRERFDKVATSYPYEADVACEREIMECARNGERGETPFAG